MSPVLCWIQPGHFCGCCGSTVCCECPCTHLVDSQNCDGSVSGQFNAPVFDQVGLQNTTLEDVLHSWSISLEGRRSQTLLNMLITRVGSRMLFCRFGSCKWGLVHMCTSMSMPMFLFPSWWAAYSLEMSSLPFTPEFSASARGSASKASANFLMAYCSRPGQDYDTKAKTCFSSEWVNAVVGEG